MKASLTIAILSLLPVLVQAAILPDTIGDWKRGDVAAAPAPEAKVWAEYGLQESETTAYTDTANKKFSVTAYRFSVIPRALLQAWNAIRPADAAKFDTDGLGLETLRCWTQYITVGNLLLVFQSELSRIKSKLGHIFLTAPHYSNGPLPTLPGYLPVGAVPNSERYILGPESLALYAPAIPSSTAAFHFSYEAEFADYEGKGGSKTTIVVFNFPGIEMAQKQYPMFVAIPGDVVKRTGPLVAIALHPTTPDEAERLLAKVKFQLK